MIDSLLKILETNKAQQKALAEEETFCKQKLYEVMQDAGIEKQESDYGTVRIQRRYEKDYGEEIKAMEAELKAAKKLKDDLGDFTIVSFKDSLVYMPPKDLF
ncbi:MAG: hypothetical protein ACO20E_06070 [Methylophilaceae bacterium]|jgi:hypothetical protein